jgi:PAS domain S-box-containing protein
MDIRIIVRDGTVYVLTGLLLAALAVALVIAVDLWVAAPVGRLIMITVVVGTVAILAAPLRDRLHRLLNRYVYRERHEYHQVVREAMERLGQLRHLDSLVTDLCTAVDRTVRPEAIELWLPSPDGSAYRLASRQGRSPEFNGPERLAANSALIDWLTRHPQPFLLDDPAAAGPDGQRAVAELAARGGELALPITGDRGLAGLLVIGPKRSGDAYFDEDLALLGALTAEAGVALANARLHQDVMRAREQIEGILQAMPSAVVAVSRHGRVEWFNDAAARLTGVSRDSVRGRELPGSHPLARLLRDTLADGQSRQEEVALADARGPAAHLVCSAAPLRDPAGEIQGAVCVGSDLSRVKELEAETRRVERLATFGAMASGIAHEIRNPLVAIKTHIQLMPEACTCAAQEEQRQFATVATREIYRIDALLDRLMEVREFPRASFTLLDLRDVVQETLLLAQATFAQDGVTLVQGLERGCWIRGDREQLKQLCLNLVVNAKEAVSANGEVHVRCWLRPNPARPTVALEVADTGPGIAEAVREILFEPFITTKRRGTGLGLALCRAITDVHRGTIRAENRTPGPGAVFTVEIPAETASR